MRNTLYFHSLGLLNIQKFTKPSFLFLFFYFFMYLKKKALDTFSKTHNKFITQLSFAKLQGKFTFREVMGIPNST